MKTAIKESELDLAFATAIRENEDFRFWVLSKTKFRATHARLMAEEQAAARRTAKHWWKHWWCKVPELGRDSETDIFMVFEIAETRRRFAIHVENKTLGGSFTEQQPESYDFRARHMMKQHRSVFGYTDFDTLLIAPLGFKEKNDEACRAFGCYIAYEDIAPYVPEFKHALNHTILQGG